MVGGGGRGVEGRVDKIEKEEKGHSCKVEIGGKKRKVRFVKIVKEGGGKVGLNGEGRREQR